MKTAAASSILALASFCTLATARADGLFVSFYNNDTVSLFDGQTGTLLNANFASVQSPLGLAIGPDHNLYVGSDSLAIGGAGIVRFGINGTTGTAQGTFVDHVSDNALNNPQGLAFRNGNLYAADITAGNIFVYNSAGSHVSTLSDPNLSGPMGLAFSSSGTLYVANQGNILSYNGGGFSQVNNNSLNFTAANSVAVGGNGKVYVLDITGGNSGGIYSVSLSDGSTQKIVDYSTSYFNASDMVMGPDGKLYVSGQDSSSGEGEILDYGTDGSGGNVFADTGFGTTPGYMTFVPEPSPLSIAGLGVAVCAVLFAGKRRARSLAN